MVPIVYTSTKSAAALFAAGFAYTGLGEGFREARARWPRRLHKEIEIANVRTLAVGHVVFRHAGFDADIDKLHGTRLCLGRFRLPPSQPPIL